MELDQDLEEWAVMGGGGYDFWQNATTRLALYVQPYMGYGRQRFKQEEWNGTGYPTTDHTDSGITADTGLGIEYRTSANWLWGAEVGGSIVAGHPHVQFTISLGVIIM